MTLSEAGRGDADVQAIIIVLYAGRIHVDTS